MIIFLTGLPGSGKTWWAKQLAEAFRWVAVDLDNEIAHRCQTTISALFAISEAHFRQKEQETLRHLLQEKDASDMILATGGGTPCFHHNLELMKAAGCVIYLKWPIRELVERILRNPVPRPLLPQTPDQLTDTLRKLASARRPFYEKAHITVTPDRLKHSDWLTILQPFLNPRNLQHNV